MQPNSLIKSTFKTFNVLQKSACMQSSATIDRTDTMDLQAKYSSMALKSGGSVPEIGGQDPSAAFSCALLRNERNSTHRLQGASRRMRNWTRLPVPQHRRHWTQGMCKDLVELAGA